MRFRRRGFCRVWNRALSLVFSVAAADLANTRGDETNCQLFALSVVGDTLDQTANDSHPLPGIERLPHEFKLLKRGPQIGFVDCLAFETPEFQNDVGHSTLRLTDALLKISHA